MKFFILLLAVFIPLLTSTEGKNSKTMSCYLCSTTNPSSGDCINLNGVTGKDSCPPRYCATWFYADGKLDARSCFDPDEGYNPDGVIAKLGCQYIRDKKQVCLCDTENCNGVDTQPLNSNKKGGKVNGKNNNTCKMVGMPLTTLLGGVLALSLFKYL